MTRNLTRLRPALLLLGCVLTLSTSVQATNVPDVILTRIDGVEQSMQDYIGKGKWVVVNVWSPTCTACVNELPELESFERKHRGNITVLGITIDFPSFEYGKIEIIKTFLKSHPLDYPLFLADLETASEVIGNRLVGIPLTAIFHPDGKAVARWPGYIDIDEIEDFMESYSEYYTDDALTEGF